MSRFASVEAWPITLRQRFLLRERWRPISTRATMLAWPPLPLDFKLLSVGSCFNRTTTRSTDGAEASRRARVSELATRVQRLVGSWRLALAQVASARRIDRVAVCGNAIL